MADSNYEDLFNSDVIDVDGDKVGSIGQVYLDDQTGQPSWVTVKTGWFGLKETFVPLEQAEISEGTIKVPYSEEKIKAAPRVDPDKHLDADEEAQLYEYYGIATVVSDEAAPVVTDVDAADEVDAVEDVDAVAPAVVPVTDEPVYDEASPMVDQTAVDESALDHAAADAAAVDEAIAAEEADLTGDEATPVVAEEVSDEAAAVHDEAPVFVDDSVSAEADVVTDQTVAAEDTLVSEQPAEPVADEPWVADNTVAVDEAAPVEQAPEVVQNDAQDLYNEVQAPEQHEGQQR